MLEQKKIIFINALVKKADKNLFITEFFSAEGSNPESITPATPLAKISKTTVKAIPINPHIINLYTIPIGSHNFPLIF